MKKQSICSLATLFLFAASTLNAMASDDGQIIVEQPVTAAAAPSPDTLGRQLIEALQENNNKQAHDLIMAGANLMYRDPVKGNTPLIAATRNNNLIIVRELLKAGYEKEEYLELHDYASSIPARRATMHALLSFDETNTGPEAMFPPEIVMTMLNPMHAFKLKLLEQRDKTGKTALNWAAVCGHIKIAQTLINHDADVNTQDKYGISPLMEAGYKCSRSLTSLLFEYGADINMKDNKNQTALMDAASNGYFDMVKYLVKNGANTKDVNSHGETASMLARSEEHDTIADFLEAHDRPPKCLAITSWLKKNAALLSATTIGIASLAIAAYKY